MTGYGKGTYKNENAEVSCEIRTVNNRYLDLSLKMPRQFFAYEAELKELVKEKITRGHAEIGVNKSERHIRGGLATKEKYLLKEKEQEKFRNAY